MLEHTFVFIGGLHRSGTTLAADILSRHPDVSGFTSVEVHEGEGQFLQTVFPTDNEYGGPGRFAFDRRAHRTENSALVSDENRKDLWHQWSKYWDLEKPLLLEKSPANIIQGRFLQALFPQSYFIFIVRNPIAVSLATFKWSGTGIYSLLHHWCRCHEIMDKDLEHLKRAMVIHFDDLISHPKEEIHRMLQFLNLRDYQCQTDIDSHSNDTYLGQWKKYYLPSTQRAKPIPPLGAVHDHKAKFPHVNYKRLIKTYIKKRVFGEERQMSLTSYEALDALEMFEERVNHFGYSMKWK